MHGADAVSCRSRFASAAAACPTSLLDPFPEPFLVPNPEPGTGLRYAPVHDRDPNAPSHPCPWPCAG
jgi:hypothetical protein